MSKNLVYCCIFYNKDYFKLLNLLLTSLKFYSTTDNFDILILTHDSMIKNVQELSTKLKLNLLIKTFNFTTIFQAACARLFIFDYHLINNYEKILYIDTDIIIKKDLNIIFNLNIGNQLYGIQSGNISNLSFGRQFFNFDKISPNTSGINSGTLFFKNIQCIRDLFSRINGHIQAFTDSKEIVPYCMDQPFINYHAIILGMYNNILLNPYVSLYEDNDIVTNYNTSIICHFSYPIGNFLHKFDRMKKFFNQILNEEISNNFILDKKKYLWNNGFIEFDNSKVITTWGSGESKVLNKNKVLVCWNNFNHILKLDNESKNYMSVRIKPMDFEVVFGVEN